MKTGVSIGQDIEDLLKEKKKKPFGFLSLILGYVSWEFFPLL